MTDFTSYQMTNFWKSYLKQEIHMLFNLIFRNVLMPYLSKCHTSFSILISFPVQQLANKFVAPVGYVFQELANKIQGVNKLQEYFDVERHTVCLFYFLSNDELLEILSQTRNPHAVQPHLQKCFDAISK